VKRLYSLIVISTIVLSGYGQASYNCWNFGFTPKINTTSNGIWKAWSRTIEADSTQNGHPDSVYVNFAGLPNYGDLQTFDLELKMKALWKNDSIFFLFQRFDDVFVNGLNEEGKPDLTVAPGLDNLDATKIYFYLSTDSLRLDSTYNYSDSIAWLQFVWKSDTMLARLPSGQLVNTYSDFHTKAIQWCSGSYCYAKLGIDIHEIAPYLMDDVSVQMDSLGFGGFGFLLETTENDKEILNDDRYVLQTRTFWNSLIDSAAENHVNMWNWFTLKQDKSNFYITPIAKIRSNFAAIYPIPANESFFVQVKDYGHFSFSLFDIMGRLVVSGHFDGVRHEIPVEQLETGTYFIQLKNSDGDFMSKKILIIR
jgi:hypothetical protein